MPVVYFSLTIGIGVLIITHTLEIISLSPEIAALGNALKGRWVTGASAVDKKMEIACKTR